MGVWGGATEVWPLMLAANENRGKSQPTPLTRLEGSQLTRVAKLVVCGGPREPARLAHGEDSAEESRESEEGEKAESGEAGRAELGCR